MACPAPAPWNGIIACACSPSAPAQDKRKSGTHRVAEEDDPPVHEAAQRDRRVHRPAARRRDALCRKGDQRSVSDSEQAQNVLRRCRRWQGDWLC